MLRQTILAVLVIALGATALVAAPGPVRIWPTPPSPGPGWVRVWVPAEYRTVYVRVWVEERTQRMQERVWVPACYKLRDILDTDEWGRRSVQQECVEVPGYWTYQWKTVVIPAHEEVTSRQELVRAGYWQWVQVEVPPVPMPMPEPRPVYREQASVGVEGYSSGTASEDLSKFSPLTEWPDKK